MTAPNPQPGILGINPYVGGRSASKNEAKLVKLSSNESPLGPSARAIDALRRQAANVHRYPDGGATGLREALAGHYGLDAGRIICGNGSDEILSLLVQAYAGVGDEILYSEHGFLMYALSARANGAVPVAAPETNRTADVDALLAAVTDRTRIVFVANPNNPTGTYLKSEEVERLRRELKDDVLLVIDAAYAEYVSRNDYSPGIELVEACDNVVMTRTFSKIYGLAGLRVGWAYGPAPVIDVLHRVRGPFNVNLLAQEAALAALQDVAHVDAARTHNDIWLPWLAEEISKLGLEVTPSVGNFVLIGFPEGGKSAENADAFLMDRGLILREMRAYGLPNCLRMTVGLEDENRAVVEALKDFLNG